MLGGCMNKKINKAPLVLYLELNQVDLYMAKSKIFKNQDKKARLVFERITLIEQNHDNMAKSEN